MLLGFFEWCETTRIGTVVRDSLWLFPVIEATHLLGLSLLGGSLLVVDLRMLGWGLRGRPIAELARHVRPWLWAALGIMVVTGVPLFLSEAVKCYYNPAFWLKMRTLPLALLFTLVVRERMTRNPALDTSARTRLAGAVSLGLWLTVAAAGRWIGFSS